MNHPHVDAWVFYDLSCHSAVNEPLLCYWERQATYWLHTSTAILLFLQPSCTVCPLHSMLYKNAKPKKCLWAPFNCVALLLMAVHDITFSPDVFHQMPSLEPCPSPQLFDPFNDMHKVLRWRLCGHLQVLMLHTGCRVVRTASPFLPLSKFLA